MPAAHAMVLGCRVDAVGSQEAVRTIVALAREPDPSIVITLGTEMIMRAQRDESFRTVINASALSLCDTIGVLYAARAQGAPIPERVTGVDLMEPLCQTLAWEGLSIFLLGGKGDTAARAGQALSARHSGLVIAGARDGYFSPGEDAAVAEQIHRSGARVVFVGLGSPRQELWLAANVKASGAAVGIGVGGSFDVLAGDVARAPELWRKLNLEWFYRLVREPQRWRRQLALPAFVLLALRERIATGFERKRAA